MNMKLFDQVEVSHEGLVELPELSTEEIVENMQDMQSVENEFQGYLSAVKLAYESAARLQSTIDDAKLSIEEEKPSKAMLLQLNKELMSTYETVGLEPEHKMVMSSEDIDGDVEEAIKLSIEEGQNLIVKIIANINKTFARTSNILGKYISKFNTFLGSIGKNLTKTKEDLAQYKDVKLDDTLSASMFWNIGNSALLGMLAISDTNKPVEGLNEAIATFGQPDSAKKLFDSIVSLVSKDQPLKPIFGKENVIKKLSNSGWLKSIFCKSKKDDKLVIGTTFNTIFLLERCKLFGIKSNAVAYNYSVEAANFIGKGLFGTGVTFDTPTFDELNGLIDEGIKAVANRKKYINEIHSLMKIGSSSIKKLDDETSYVNLGIYGVLPSVLLVFSRTFGEIPTTIYALSKVYIKEAKKAQKESK